MALIDLFVREVFLQRPSAALKVHAAATAVWQRGLQCEITGPGGEKAVTDMSPPMGGEGAGASAGWLLRASLASCAATAIAMRAAQRGIELHCLEVTVHGESDGRGLVGIDGVSTAHRQRMWIRIGAHDVSDERLRELAETGEAISPVGCTLRERPSMALEVSVV
jgi:uncharacterized OsmC-like protein